MVVLELLHLKMEVTVSEPCDVIRVGKHCHHVQLDCAIYFQLSVLTSECCCKITFTYLASITDVLLLNVAKTR